MLLKNLPIEEEQRGRREYHRAFPLDIPSAHPSPTHDQDKIKQEQNPSSLPQEQPATASFPNRSNSALFLPRLVKRHIRYSHPLQEPTNRESTTRRRRYGAYCSHAREASQQEGEQTDKARETPPILRQGRKASFPHATRKEENTSGEKPPTRNIRSRSYPTP